MVKPKEMPNEKLTAVTLTMDKPYTHLKNSIVFPPVRKIYDGYMKETLKYKDPSTLLPSHICPLI
jgi:hypothetical protein